jgi:hypothetical protein
MIEKQVVGKAFEEKAAGKGRLRKAREKGLWAQSS